MKQEWVHKVQVQPFLRPKRSKSFTSMFSAPENISTEEIVSWVLGVIDDIIKRNGEPELDSLYKIVLWGPGNVTDTESIDTENKKREIHQRINNIIKNWDAVLLKAIYESIYKISWESISINDIDLNDPCDYARLTEFSRKKVIAKYFKDHFPDRKERKKLLWSLTSILNYTDRAHLEMLNIHPAYWYAQDLFWGDKNQAIWELIYSFGVNMSPDEQELMLYVLRNWWVSESLIARFEDEIGRHRAPHLLLNNITNPVLSQETDSLPCVKNQSRRSNNDFNPMVMDLNIADWMKVFSEARFKEIYQKIFYAISQKIITQTWWQEPSTNWLFVLEKDRLTSDNHATSWEEKEKKSSQIYQYLLEWNVPEDFDEKKLLEVVKLIREEWYDINLSWWQGSQSLQYPKTRNWVLRFQWHTSETWSSRVGNHAILIEDTKSWEKDLRIWLSNFSQDSYTYLVAQIGHYMEHWHFIDKHQLYTEIYKNYNRLSYWENQLFDISVFEEQYDAFMNKLIIPHSLEAAELWIKSDHILLAWLYGSWKSQFLLNLLTESKYSYEWKEFNLNANVITIDLMTFKATVINNIWGFRTRLDEIYQNTGLWIILVIEDLDTLVDEKLTWWNDEVAQGITLLFEWIGSIPITIVTTANDPTKFSERLIRPNRLYEIIEFYLPSVEQKYKILNQHLENKWIEISGYTRARLEETKIFINGTASHIWKFVDELSSYVKVQKLIHWETISLTDDKIIEIAQWINISIDDIENTKKIIKQWVRQSTWSSNDQENKMWFVWWLS